MHAIGEGESALADILGANLTRKIIQAAEDVCVDLLQALYRSRLQRIQKAAFKEVIRLLLALPIDGIVAVGKPVQEGICPVGGIMLRQRLDTFCIKRIRCTLLAIRGLKLEVVSDTHELNSITAQLMARIMSIAENHHLE